MKRSSSENKGFTLIELVIVVAVLAILVGLLAPSYTKYVKKSKVTKCEAQRDEIERAYQIACIEDSKLAGCTSLDWQSVLGTEDLLEYIGNMGFYDTNQATCPVYQERYNLKLIDNGGTTAITVCRCIEDVFNYIELAKDVYKDKYHSGYGREIIIEEFYKRNGNSLPEVSQALKNGSDFENRTLYWRPYTLNGKEVVLFASDGNNSAHANWKGYLLYVNGKVYQSTALSASKKPDGTGVAWLRNATFENIDELAKENNFVLVQG